MILLIIFLKDEKKMTSNNTKIDPDQFITPKPFIHLQNFFKLSQNPFKISKTFSNSLKPLHKPTKLSKAQTNVNKRTNKRQPM
jgi:hypothetical protein